MAVTLLGSATFNTTSGTKTVTATPAVGDLIVIITAHTGNTSSAAPTDNRGGTYTLINTAQKATNADTMRFWVRNTMFPAALSTVFTHAPGTSTGGGLAVFKVTGMSRTGSNAVRQSAVQNNQAAGTPAPAFGSAALTGNQCIGAVFNATSPAGMTAPGSWTERSDQGYSTPTAGLETASRDSGETGTTITWGSASASAYCSGVIELDTSALAKPEDSDGWWGGAQLCGVGVAIAGAAAALSASVAIATTMHRHASDMWTPPASTVGDAVSTTQHTGRAQADTKLQRWWQTDEWVPQPATIVEDDPAPRFVYLVPEIKVQGPEWDDQALSWAVDEVYACQAYQPAAQIAPQPFSADDDFVPTAKDDDAWLPPPIAAPPPFMPRLAADDDFALPPAATIVEDEPPPDLRAWPVAPRLPDPWADGDEIELLAVDEQYEWSARALDQAPVIRLWLGDDEVVTQPAAFFLTDDDPPEIQRSLDSATYTVWAETDDIVPQPAQSMGGTIQHEEVNVVRWYQGDELPQVVAVEIVDDDYWVPPGPPIIAPFVHLWHQQDEAPRVVPFEYDTPELSRNQDAPTFTVWAETEDIVPQPVPLDDGYWLLQVPSAPEPGLADPWAHQDEAPQPPPYALDDTQWRPALVITPAPFFTPPWGHDDELLVDPNQNPDLSDSAVGSDSITVEITGETQPGGGLSRGEYERRRLKRAALLASKVLELRDRGIGTDAIGVEVVPIEIPLRDPATGRDGVVVERILEVGVDDRAQGRSSIVVEEVRRIYPGGLIRSANRPRLIRSGGAT